MKGGEPRRPQQLPLGLGHAPAMTRADFLVGEANRAAVALVDAWPYWPGPAVVLAGPPGSGKTHLVEVWRAAADAAVVSARAVEVPLVEALVARPAIAVEDLDVAPVDEAALFHLINRAREGGVPLLLTSRIAPAALKVRLPDLASRLRAAHLVSLGPPDDDLLRRVLVKLFADRQLTVDPAVLDYLLPRMERSLAAACRIVDLLDGAALAGGKAITRPLAAAALRGSDVFPGEPGEP